MPTYEVAAVEAVVGPPGPKGEKGDPGVPPLTVADTPTVDLTGAGVPGDPLKADVLPAGLPPVATTDTSTVDLTGTGTAADPLKADVLPAGLPPVTTGDTSTVDLTGTGTVASPLTADVKPDGLPAISKADSTEIAFTGDGKTTPLTAALKGTRTGDWSVPSGNVVIGDPVVAAQRAFTTASKVGAADAHDLSFVMASSGYGNLTLRKNAVEINRFIVGTDGSIQAYSGGVQRPFPFAMYATANAVSVSNAVTGTLALTFPAGRFTVGPTVQVTTNGGSPAYSFATNANAITATGCQILVRNLDNAVSTSTVTCSLLAVQMTPTTAAGFADVGPTETVEHLVTCHTEDCDNAEIAIPMALADENTAVVCGVCGQPITDVTTP